MDKIKSNMNSKRTTFELPDDQKINITPNLLLGFIEGDGSFNIIKKDNILQFSSRSCAAHTKR